MIRFRREDGFAMVTALLVSFVVAMIVLVAIQTALHNSQQSGYDRRRVQALEASEAGLNYYYSLLSSTPYASYPCSPVSQTLSSVPSTTYSVTATFYNASGATLACPLLQSPDSVLLRSVGKMTALANPTRTMESKVSLSITTTGSFPGGAIYGYSSIHMNSNSTVLGGKYNDADIYTNGDMNLNSNNTIYGNLYALGNVNMTSKSEVKRDLWAYGSVAMNSSATVRGNVTSSTSSISLTSAAHIYGNAKAGTSVSAASGAIGGTRTQYLTSPAPPLPTYPSFTFVSSDWTNAGYTNQQTWSGVSCTNAANYLQSNWTSGNLLMRLTSMGSSPCTLNPPTKTLPGNLAIVTDGPVTFLPSTRWSATGGPYNVSIFAGLGAVPGYCNFTTTINSGIGANLNALIYVPKSDTLGNPCAITLNSNSSLASGQLYGGSVTMNSNSTFAYKQIAVPGASTSGFGETIVYEREVT
ncbi:MAG: hypothetical protein M3Q23_10265 [Actinomycetota bacterium]|nr:hypothetical protein [Actinomycetota bacterium]